MGLWRPPGLNNNQALGHSPACKRTYRDTGWGAIQVSKQAAKHKSLLDYRDLGESIQISGSNSNSRLEEFLKDELPFTVNFWILLLILGKENKISSNIRKVILLQAPFTKYGRRKCVLRIRDLISFQIREITHTVYIISFRFLPYNQYRICFKCSLCKCTWIRKKVLFMVEEILLCHIFGCWNLCCLLMSAAFFNRWF